MSGMQHSTYTPKSGLGRWIDARMPLPRLMYDSFVAYPVPRNLNYAYTFGGIGVLNGTRLGLNVRNAFDRDPPFVDAGLGYDPSAASALGRLVSISLSTSL